MKVSKILGDRYKLLYGTEIVYLISKALKEESPLTEYQEHVLREKFENCGAKRSLDAPPFIAYSWKEEEPSGKFPWRLTLPLFVIYVFVIMALILPIKWIFTGKYSFSQTSNFGRFNTAWYNKIFHTCTDLKKDYKIKS